MKISNNYFLHCTKTFSGQAKQELEVLCNLCEAESPKEVLAQLRKCDIDSTVLKTKFFVREASPIPFHPTRHPFQTACRNSNLPVIRLLLEIGADPDADCCANYTHQTPREAFVDNALVQELFEGGKCWWKVEYSEAKKQELQGELEQNILDGEPSEAIWLMTHGVRLSAPNVLANVMFRQQSSAFKELICRMGIPVDRLPEFHSWLKDHCTDMEIQDIMDTLIQAKDDKEGDVAEKLLLSIGLIGMDKLDEVAGRTFSLPVQIRMLQYFIDSYDGSEHQSFMEKTIASLFKEILYRCMEV